MNKKGLCLSYLAALGITQLIQRGIASIITVGLGLSINLLVSLAGNAATQEPSPKSEEPEVTCSKSMLDLLKSHKVQKNETLVAIATKYNLTTATLMALNPAIRSGKVEVGQTLKIPPTNGLIHRLGNEENYRAIATKYNVRADVLFERNGCKQKPEVVFVPGAVWRQEIKVPNLLAAAQNFPKPESNTFSLATQILPPIIFAAGGYPLPYPVPVTSNYGWRMNPVTGDWAFHSGIDLGAAQGTPVLATKAGVVESAGWGGGYGNLIELSHDGFGTRYAHLSLIQVQVGQKVVRGQQIGLVGSTGRSTGPHLHFEMLSPSADGWATVNPAPFLSRFAALPQWFASLW